MNIEGAFQHLLTDLYAFAATAAAEIAPERVEVEEVGLAMARHAQVVEVHDLHVWEISSGFPALSAHVLVDPDADCHAIRRELERLVHDRFEIEHTTLQVDHAHPDRLLQIGEAHKPHGAGRSGA